MREGESAALINLGQITNSKVLLLLLQARVETGSCMRGLAQHIGSGFVQLKAERDVVLDVVLELCRKLK